MESKTILVVDDDKNICKLLDLYLSNEGYKLVFCHDGSQALDMLKINTIDLILLDIMLPVINGWEVCRIIRQEYTTPIIMITARDLLEDKLTGFELGADDYIVKPFEPKEVVARVKARLKQPAVLVEAVKSNVLTVDNLTIDIEKYEAKVDGNIIDLKPKEIQLLHFLVYNKNLVFSRDKLLEKVWDYSYSGDTRTVDVHITRIREKLEGLSKRWSIKTIWGVGYKFEVK